VTMRRQLRIAGPVCLSPALGLGTVGAFGYTAAQLAIPLILGAIVDDGLLAADVHALARLVVLLVVAATASTLFKGLHHVSFNGLGERRTIELQRDLLAHLQRLPLAYLDQERSGRLHALVTQDAPALAKLVGPTLGSALLGIVQLVALMTLLSVRYGWLALLALVLAPIYLIFPTLFSGRTRRAARAALAARSEVHATLQESIQGIREIRVFGREEWSLARLVPALNAQQRTAVHSLVIRSAYSLNYALYFAIGAVVYWFGGLETIGGRLSVGDLVALVALFGYLDRPVNEMATLSAELQTSAASGDRLLEVMDQPIERDPNEGCELPKGVPTIRLTGVSFTYPGTIRPALRDLDLTVEAGSRVAVVGPSGAGKSSLVSLLLGLYAPTAGSIHVADVDIGRCSLRSLRERIGLVPQELTLFAASVRDNILFGRTGARHEEVVVCARLADAHDFIERLPDGYETQIGERGVRLSGGQRQRLGIARVLLRDPGILLLDEATSALDAESERTVQAALDRAMAGRTSLVVAHRLATVVHADRIAVLDEGQLIAFGRHAELLADCPTYRRLCRLQGLDTSLLTPNHAWRDR